MYSRALIATLTLLLLATPAWSAPFVERARRIADRHALARALKARKVHLPAGSHLLLWRIARDATARALNRIGEAVLRIAPSLPKAKQPSAHHQMHEGTR